MKMKGEKHTNIESTQLLMKERLKEHNNLSDRYYVMAESQTAGRGRSDHSWISLKGNLHVSILLRETPFPEITWIPLWVSVCVHQALVSLGVDGSLIQLKWPNDLWIDHSKKIGGILCEKSGDSIIAGIGLNLAHAPFEGAGIVPGSAPLSVDEVLEKTLFFLSESISVQSLKQIYGKNALFNSGDAIQWNSHSEEKFSGKVIGLGLHGELLVEMNGKKVQLFTEEVRMMRGAALNK